LYNAQREQENKERLDIPLIKNSMLHMKLEKQNMTNPFLYPADRQMNETQKSFNRFIYIIIIHIFFKTLNQQYVFCAVFH